MTTLLAPAAEDRLRRLDLSHPEVGRTQGDVPPGYTWLSRRATIGAGPERFDAATEALFDWQLQRRADVRVLPSSASVTVGAVAVLLLGVGPVAVRAPVRVVYVIREPRRVGFAYGTLPGHPESGEEAFLVELAEDGNVTCQITAFSRPASRLARVGGPLTTLIQQWVTWRYLRSLAR